MDYEKLKSYLQKELDKIENNDIKIFVEIIKNHELELLVIIVYDKLYNVVVDIKDMTLKNDRTKIVEFSDYYNNIIDFLEENILEYCRICDKYYLFKLNDDGSVFKHNCKRILN